MLIQFSTVLSSLEVYVTDFLSFVVAAYTHASTQAHTQAHTRQPYIRQPAPSHLLLHLPFLFPICSFIPSQFALAPIKFIGRLWPSTWFHISYHQGYSKFKHPTGYFFLLNFGLSGSPHIKKTLRVPWFINGFFGFYVLSINNLSQVLVCVWH